jgi:hypothetical protein
MGVVEQDAVTALAGRNAANRGRQLEPRHVVLQSPLTGLGHGEAIAPQLPVARAGDDASKLVVVSIKRPLT